jgi:putative PIN family toxin of toxin-antitoxin system
VTVVIDTNVWISALQFAKRRGTPTLALEKAMSEDVIATCDEIDAEIVRVLTEKFSWEQHRATSALQAILARGIRVKIRGTIKVCRDPNDDMFLECAALAKPDLLVTDLPRSRRIGGIQALNRMSREVLSLASP